MREIPKEDFIKTVNEVAYEVYSKTKNFETLASETFDVLKKDYTFYAEKPPRLVKKTIQEQVTLPDGRTISVPKEVEEWITKRVYQSIYDMFRGTLDPVGSLNRIIDCSSFPKPKLNHKPNEKIFIENAAKLFFNTDAYSVGDTLSNFRIFCQNIHKNLETPGSEMAENKALYQYSMKGGSGKSYFGKIALKAMGRLGFEANPASISGRWVGSDFSKNLVSFIDEFMPPKGESKDYFITKFNPIVNNDFYEVEYKGVDKYHVRSISSVILNSNYLPFDTNTRRYGIIKYNEFDLSKGNFKFPYTEEELIQAFINCLESVPFNKYWENPIKTTSSSMSKLIWMAREVENQVGFNIVSKSATIREFVNAYMNISDKEGKHSRIGMTREVFDIILSNDIQPVKKINGDLQYSKYDFESISQMSTIEDEVECSLDSIQDIHERTQAAFKMYLPQQDPTPPSYDDKYLYEETFDYKETFTEDDISAKESVHEILEDNLESEEIEEIEEAVDSEMLEDAEEPKPLMDAVEDWLNKYGFAGEDSFILHEQKLLEQGLVVEKPVKEESAPTDIYPEDFDMSTKQFTSYDAYRFGTPVFKTRFEKEGNLDVKGDEEFLCSSTYKSGFVGAMNRKGINMKPVFFVYESDDLTKDEQHLAIKPALLDPEKRKHIFSVTDSGSKSLHVLVHIDPEYQEEALRSYKYYWRQVGEYIFGKEYMSKCDQNVASNARLTRMPGGTRDNGNLQRCFYINRKVEGVKFLSEWVYAVDESLRIEKEAEEQIRKRFQENRGKYSQTDEMTTLNNFYKARPDKWEVAKTLVDGGDPGSGSNMIGAIGMLKKAGLLELADVAKHVAHQYHPSNIS